MECVDDESQIVRDLGAAAAFYMEATLRPGDVIGLSSWSAALRAMVDAMHPSQRGAGAVSFRSWAELAIRPPKCMHASDTTAGQSDRRDSDPAACAGVVGSAEARKVMVRDQYVSQAMELFKSVNVALVGLAAWNRRICSR